MLRLTTGEGSGGDGKLVKFLPRDNLVTDQGIDDLGCKALIHNPIELQIGSNLSSQHFRPSQAFGYLSCFNHALL